MAKKTGGQKTPSYGFAADAKGKGRKLDSYEDTIEPGTVDDCESWSLLKSCGTISGFLRCIHR